MVSNIFKYIQLSQFLFILKQITHELSNEKGLLVRIKFKIYNIALKNGLKGLTTRNDILMYIYMYIIKSCCIFV